MNNIRKKTFIIAEAGVNHNGSLEFAKRLVDVAFEAGADAVKFQTFRTEDLTCLNAPKADYQNRATDLFESQFKMLKSLELNEKDQIELYHYCGNRKLLFLSTPFDLGSADFLINTLNISIIKIASGEITNFPLLLKIAQSGKPVILSTGMSTLGEIEMALNILAFGYLYPNQSSYPSLPDCEETYFSNQGQQLLQKNVSLLHCTSEYPAPFDEVNLKVLNTLQNAFNLQVGYSDHTLGMAVSIAAVASGAKIIEKHFTLDKTLPGPDHQASLEPQELASMIKSIRQVELALGVSTKIPSASELKNRLISRKSLVALQKIGKGEIFTEQNIGCKRPGHGISPIHFWSLKDRCAERDYEQDEVIGA